MGLRREGVVVHHGGGQLEVAVEDAVPQDDSGETLALRDGRSGVSLVDLDAEPGEAIGYSRAYDLREAIEDAIRQLPPQGPDIPDWLSTYTVVSIGAELGGIGGFNHLKVHVRG